MSFFEPPPPAPEPPSQPRPMPWMGPPQNVLGAVVPLGLLLARTEEVAATVGGFVAYPSGLELTLAVRSRRALGDPAHWPFHQRVSRGDPLAPEVFRFGVQFADGRKATTLDQGFGPPLESPASAIVLVQHGGGGGDRQWNQRFWLWPLPPPGPLSLVCEWPKLGIELTRHEIDAQVVLDAAARAELLWPDDDDDGQGFVTEHIHVG